jgi:hypothetical protein
MLDDLIRSKHVDEETSKLHASRIHQQRTNKTKNLHLQKCPWGLNE